MKTKLMTFLREAVLLPLIGAILVIGGVGFALDRVMSLLEQNVHAILALPALIGRGIAWMRPSAVNAREVARVTSRA